MNPSKKVIPALIGQPRLSDEVRDIFSLAFNVGMLNIQKPTDHSDDYYCSKNIAEDLTDENIGNDTKEKRNFRRN